MKQVWPGDLRVTTKYLFIKVWPLDFLSHTAVEFVSSTQPISSCLRLLFFFFSTHRLLLLRFTRSLFHFLHLLPRHLRQIAWTAPLITKVNDDYFLPPFAQWWREMRKWKLFSSSTVDLLMLGQCEQMHRLSISVICRSIIFFLSPSVFSLPITVGQRRLLLRLSSMYHSVKWIFSTQPFSLLNFASQQQQQHSFHALPLSHTLKSPHSGEERGREQSKQQNHQADKNASETAREEKGREEKFLLQSSEK